MFENSLALYRRAKIIPGRSLTRSKAPGRFGAVGEVPLYAEGGQGPWIACSDGQSYIDMLCGLGAISLGYFLVDEQDAGQSTGVYSLPHCVEVEAAEAVLEHVAPWASSVRFVKTGSEATHAAYRIAKQATGRASVWRGDWSYHGWHEWVDQAKTFPHGADFSMQGVDVPAAVFIEPHRWEPVDVEWLRSVRDWCTKAGALLVFDEMIYGGRWALGGASEYFGIQPDLACYGKAFGNGQSVAFVVGNEALEDHGEIVSGTYSGDVAGLQAVIGTIDAYLAEGVIDTLWARGRQLQGGLRHLGIEVQGAPVHQRIVFRDKAQGLRFSTEMAKRGVLWHPDVTNIMAAHSSDIIDRVLTAAGESWKVVQ